jgi:hypothetical protein
MVILYFLIKFVENAVNYDTMITSLLTILCPVMFVNSTSAFLLLYLKYTGFGGFSLRLHGPLGLRRQFKEVPLWLTDGVNWMHVFGSEKKIGGDTYFRGVLCIFNFSQFFRLVYKLF